MADPLPHNVLELGYIQQYWSYKVPKVCVCVWGGGGGGGSGAGGE